MSHDQAHRAQLDDSYQEEASLCQTREGCNFRADSVCRFFVRVQVLTIELHHQHVTVPRVDGINEKKNIDGFSLSSGHTGLHGVTAR